MKGQKGGGSIGGDGTESANSEELPGDLDLALTPGLGADHNLSS